VQHLLILVSTCIYQKGAEESIRELVYDVKTAREFNGKIHWQAS